MGICLKSLHQDNDLDTSMQFKEVERVPIDEPNKFLVKFILLGTIKINTTN